MTIIIIIDKNYVPDRPHYKAGGYKVHSGISSHSSKGSHTLDRPAGKQPGEHSDADSGGGGGGSGGDGGGGAWWWWW